MADQTRSFGAYEFTERLGSGGFATVFRGVHRDLGSTVAIKVLSETMAHDDQFIGRFRQEAEFASHINHRNIVKIFDYGPWRESFCIVMEFVDGSDLTGVIRGIQPRRLPVVLALILLDEIAAGLAAAHAQSVFHRDIKPGNVLLSRSGEVKIGDFGLARSDSESAHVQTVHGAILGTPNYLSPEQALASTDIDWRCDIFSLGVVAYELISGQRPFAGPSTAEILARVIKAEYEPVDRVCPHVPPVVKRLIEGMIQRDPADRTQSMTEVRAIIAESIEWCCVSSIIPNRADAVHELVTQGAPFVDHVNEKTFACYKRLHERGDREEQRRATALLKLVEEDLETGLYARAGDESMTQMTVGIGGGARPRGGGITARLMQRLRPPLARAALLIILVVGLMAGGWWANERYGPFWPPGGAGGDEEAAPRGQPATGQVALRSEPEGAVILYAQDGGAFVEHPRRTPAELELEPGRYRIRLEKPGYEPLVLDRAVHVEEGRRLALDPVVLRPQPAVVTVTSTPEGATIDVAAAGEELHRLEGRTPDVVELHPGRWRLQLARDGQRSPIFDLDLAPGGRDQVEHDFTARDTQPPTEPPTERPPRQPPTTPAGARLVVTSQPSGARVSYRAPGETLFRVLPGTTPLESGRLPAGSYEVLVALAGHAQHLERVDLDDDGNRTVHVDLEAQAAGDKAGVYIVGRPKCEAGFRVFVDGVERESRVELPPGGHLVRAECSGHRATQVTVTSTQGEVLDQIAVPADQASREYRLEVRPSLQYLVVFQMTGS